MPTEAKANFKAKDSCPLCMSEDRVTIEENLAKGEISKKVVAEELGTTVDVIYQHMMNHFSTGLSLRSSDDKPQKLKELYNKKDIIFTTMIQLKERMDLFMKKDEYSASETSQIVKMAEEVRRQVETMAKLEGELKSETTYTVNMYIELRNIVLSTLCGECRKRVLTALEASEKAIDVIDLTRAEIPGR